MKLYNFLSKQFGRGNFYILFSIPVHGEKINHMIYQACKDAENNWTFFILEWNTNERDYEYKPEDIHPTPELIEWLSSQI